MNALQPPAPLVRWTRRLEASSALDGAVQTLEPHVQTLFASGTRGSVLRGDWLGHSVHPALTTLVLGSWTSASVLDLLGQGKWAEPAQSLVGTGLAAFGPAAWTGWAEWSTTGPREKRVGLVHAVTNAAAVGLYAGSWLARRRDRHAAGARLALLGLGVSRAGAYLGGHLAATRKVATHHSAFDGVRAEGLD